MKAAGHDDFRELNVNWSEVFGHGLCSFDLNVYRPDWIRLGNWRTRKLV